MYICTKELEEFITFLTSIISPDSSNTHKTISGDKLRDLCTLAYSDNVDLQRSAALCLSELSEKRESLSLPHPPLVQWKCYCTCECAHFHDSVLASCLVVPHFNPYT